MALPDEPFSRLEEYLDYIAGGVSPLPEGEPRCRLEEYLEYIALHPGGGGGGTTNYNGLENKPKINGVELRGNKTSADLKLLGEDDSLTQAQIQALLALIS